MAADPGAHWTLGNDTEVGGLMNIYVAHNFSAREWLPEVVHKIKVVGHHVTSTWIFDDAHAAGGSRLSSAKVDLADIDQSSCIVLFVDQYGETPGKGKYFELGYAYAQQKRIILVGKDESCVFYWLPGIQRVADVEELIELLKKEKA